MTDLSFFKDKRVLVTGHTGFKGTWLCEVLTLAGAQVIGYAMEPPTEPSLYELCGIGNRITSMKGDIRDYGKLLSVFQSRRPEIVFHLAAQPIVRASYENPVYTYETNVMGTVHVLECVRQTDSVKSVVNVTTDKVYRNREWCWGYREEDELDGFDPYSNSKSCSELVTHSYVQSFLVKAGVAVTTARAGNVIGGGDFGRDRIVPDCIRAACNRKPLVVRNPNSVRPYQHVLEAVFAYLMIAQKQYFDISCAGNYNIGPEDEDCITTGELTDIFCRLWQEGLSWSTSEVTGPHEAGFLKLDCSKIRQKVGWRPVWRIQDALEKTVSFAKECRDGKQPRDIIDSQIEEYENLLFIKESSRHV